MEKEIEFEGELITILYEQEGSKEQENKKYGNRMLADLPKIVAKARKSFWKEYSTNNDWLSLSDGKRNLTEKLFSEKAILEEIAVFGDYVVTFFFKWKDDEDIVLSTSTEDGNTFIDTDLFY